MRRNAWCVARNSLFDENFRYLPFEENYGRVGSFYNSFVSGKVITAAYVPVVNYHNLFPDSINPTSLVQIRRWTLRTILFACFLMIYYRTTSCVRKKDFLSGNQKRRVFFPLSSLWFKITVIFLCNFIQWNTFINSSVSAHYFYQHAQIYRYIM